MVPEDELEAASLEFAEKIAAASPLVVGLGKRAFHAQADLPVAEAETARSRVMCENAVEPDAREGIEAFLEKRSPRWRQPAPSG